MEDKNLDHLSPYSVLNTPTLVTFKEEKPMPCPHVHGYFFKIASTRAQFQIYLRPHAIAKNFLESMPRQQQATRNSSF